MHNAPICSNLYILCGIEILGIVGPAPLLTRTISSLLVTVASAGTAVVATVSEVTIGTVGSMVADVVSTLVSSETFAIPYVGSKNLLETALDELNKQAIATINNNFIFFI